MTKAMSWVSYEPEHLRVVSKCIDALMNTKLRKDEEVKKEILQTLKSLNHPLLYVNRNADINMRNIQPGTIVQGTMDA